MSNTAPVLNELAAEQSHKAIPATSATLPRRFSGLAVTMVFTTSGDLRRTCARLCHQAGGELEQIQFLLGHISIQTTERNLGCKQRFRDAVNDHNGLEPDSSS
jgi:integrase